MPRKTFVNGNILTDTDLNTYLMDQAVMTFADSSARSSAIPSPSAGMVTYLSGSTAVQFYNGSAWVPITTNTAGSNVVFGGTSVSANYTAVAGLDNATIVVTGTAAVTVTVPDVISQWDSINIIRDTSGTVTIAAGSGVTTWAGFGTAGTAVTFKIDQQYNGAQVIKVAANSYRVIGKITV